jgi:hypothetical protein
MLGETCSILYDIMEQCNKHICMVDVCFHIYITLTASENYNVDYECFCRRLCSRFEWGSAIRIAHCVYTGVLLDAYSGRWCLWLSHRVQVYTSHTPGLSSETVSRIRPWSCTSAPPTPAPGTRGCGVLLTLAMGDTLDPPRHEDGGINNQSSSVCVSLHLHTATTTPPSHGVVHCCIDIRTRDLSRSST